MIYLKKLEHCLNTFPVNVKASQLYMYLKTLDPKFIIQ